MWFGTLVAKDAVARLMYSVQACSVGLVSYFTPASLPAKAAVSGASGLYIALFLLAAMLLLDVVVNDMMPSRFTLKWGIRYRYTIYPFVAFIYIGQLFVVQKAGWNVDLGALLNYGSMGFFGFLLGFRSVLFHGDRPCAVAY